MIFSHPISGNAGVVRIGTDPCFQKPFCPWRPQFGGGAGSTGNGGNVQSQPATCSGGYGFGQPQGSPGTATIQGKTLPNGRVNLVRLKDTPAPLSLSTLALAPLSGCIGRRRVCIGGGVSRQRPKAETVYLPSARTGADGKTDMGPQAGGPIYKGQYYDQAAGRTFSDHSQSVPRPA